MAEGTIAADQLRLFLERIERLDARQEADALLETYRQALGAELMLTWQSIWIALLTVAGLGVLRHRFHQHLRRRLRRRARRGLCRAAPGQDVRALRPAAARRRAAGEVVVIGAANANALTAAGLASWAAGELRFSGLNAAGEELSLAAAECVAPLLRAAAIALELSGCTADEHCAGVHDVIVDYITVPVPRTVQRMPIADIWP